MDCESRPPVAFSKRLKSYLFCLVGSIKVWDFGSGQLYKRFPDEKTKHDDTITGLMYHVINDIRFIFVSAWGRKIRILEVNIPGIPALSVFRAYCMR